ncbi:tetraspanin-19-like [Phragmites australis]|uniref:tetraspanin-19-like n=1 Tax=Phragmites australis TaxID=29695 RepID=UPI002D79748B|nr:tetraspanin-19-like [Phragmites australis]
MAGRVVRSCVQTALKAVNSVVGLAGMAVILYALWMLRAWYREVAELDKRLPVPWFIYTFLGLGIFLCLLTCSGHIAAETANDHCLSCYMFIIFVLIILEGAITVDVFLNSNWEEDFPDDPSGKFDIFKDFVRSNFEICEWVGLSVVAAQVLSIILGMVLRTLGPDREIGYDSDDDATVPARLPFLRNQSQHAPDFVEPNLFHRSDSWKV